MVLYGVRVVEFGPKRCHEITLMLSTLQANYTFTFYLHDAVYLYLRVLSQTLAEGNTDYSDGRLIRNKTIGQRFVGERLHGTLSHH